MNKEQAIKAANEIDTCYLKPYTLVVERDGHGTAISHLRWMVEEMSKGEMSGDKTMRWLGYIQGALVMCAMANLEDMKELSARAAGKL